MMNISDSVNNEGLDKELIKAFERLGYTSAQTVPQEEKGVTKQCSGTLAVSDYSDRISVSK